MRLPATNQSCAQPSLTLPLAPHSASTMPKAKRSKVVSLTTTTKKGKQSKDSLVQNVRFRVLM